MKVLVFTTQFHLLSGAERLAIELAVDLNRNSVSTDVLSLYDNSPQGAAQKACELLAMGVPSVEYLEVPVNPSISVVARAIIKLRRIILENGYDIVETSQLSPAVIAAWATLGTRCRHVGGVHAVFRRGFRDSRQLQIWRFTAWLLRSSRYYAISSYVANSWSRFTSLDRKLVHVVYNSINDAAFDAQSDRVKVDREFELPEGSRIVIFVGRLDQFKGFDTAIAAFGPVLEIENLVLLFVGHAERSDPEASEMLMAVMEKVAVEGWGKRVRFLGRREDVFRLMASSDVLVHPARTEGFGLVLAEAMAVGLQIVASNVDGIPEVLADTDSLMVPPNDPLALRDSTLEVLGKSAFERNAASDKGRKRAKAFRTAIRTSAMLEFMSQTSYPKT
jgi:glycosyltransferase involved in cell wall biosynthesis